MQTIEIEKIIFTELENAKATEIVSLDVSKLTSITDHMLICNGRSSRHIQAIADNLVVKIKQLDIYPISVVGKEAGEWVLVDLNHVIVHIMLPEVRERYALEKLWDPALFTERT